MTPETHHAAILKMAREQSIARKLATAPEQLDRFWATAPRCRDLDVDVSGLAEWVDGTNPFALIRGSVGTGKTVLACHAAAAMIARTGRTGIFVSGADMRGFNWPLPEHAVVVLDDMGVIDSPAVLENTQALIGHRYTMGQATIITTNHTPTTMMAKLGGHIADRLRTAAQVELAGPSRR